MFDQGTTNPLSPRAGFNEQRIQVKVAVIARENRCESHHRTRNFSNENSSTSNLLKRQFNGVGMGQQSITIAGVVK
jgi:hypothetical protein